MAEERGKKKFIGLLLITLICSAGVYLLQKTEVLEGFENRSWDQRLQIIARPDEADRQIKIVIIDQQALDLYADDVATAWPFPREMYGAVIKFLEHGKARGVAFDLLFTEQSKNGVADDEAFSESMKGPLPVINVLSGTNRKKLVEEDLTPVRTRQLEQNKISNFDQLLVKGLVPDFTSADIPVSPLIENSDGFGVVNARPDSDGVFRHYRPGGYVAGVPLLGLPFALYDLVAHDAAKKLPLAGMLDEHGRLTVRFHGGAQTYQTFSIADILSSSVQIEEKQTPLIDPEIFKDCWVFVGVWAPGLYDLRPTPLDPAFRGVEYNATLLDNLLHGDFIKRVPGYWSLLVALIASFLCAGALLYFQSGVLQIGTILGALGAFLGLSVYLAFSGFWIATVAPGVGIISSILLALAYSYQLEGKQRRFIKNAFSHYLSQDVIDQLVRDPDSLALGGERRELTVFFSDLEGFTRFSESMPPTQLTALLNRYLTAMTDIILEYGGTLDKYVGDAVVAFWNAPVPIPDHPTQAVLAVLKCQERLAEMQAEFQKDFGIQVKMRVGLHSGEASVGNFGSNRRFNYTIIGDTVNLAARLEGVNKVFGTTVLISSAVRERLPAEVCCRKIGEVLVVGKSQSIGIFEPLGKRKPDWFDAFDTARSRFEAGSLNEARGLFEKISNDPVAAKYLTRIAHELNNGSGSPGWSPVWSLTEK